MIYLLLEIWSAFIRFSLDLSVLVGWPTYYRLKWNKFIQSICMFESFAYLEDMMICIHYTFNSFYIIWFKASNLISFANKDILPVHDLYLDKCSVLRPQKTKAAFFTVFCNFQSGWQRITAGSVMWHIGVYKMKISKYLKPKYSDIISLFAWFIWHIHNPLSSHSHFPL